MIDWSQINTAILETIKAYAEYLREDERFQRPFPGKWSSAHTSILKEEEQRFVWRGKRKVIDYKKRVVAEWADKSTAEYVAVLDPTTVLVMVRTIEQMANIIATYRNRDKVIKPHTGESVREDMMERNRILLEKKVKQEIETMALEHKGSYAAKLEKDIEETRQKLLKKKHVTVADQYWLLSYEELSARGFTQVANNKGKKNKKKLPKHRNS